jgi:myo-inositol 2-dehydrogenase/D-chiro-inositol 1-dehydrogenase
MPKVAITGAGYAARYYIRALNELGYPIVGITNRTKERGLQLAKEANIPFYDSCEQMVEESGAEMIIMATATCNHLGEVQAAVKGGARWIFCEKPVGTDLAETRKIRDICEEYKAVIGIGYKMRYESIFKQAKEMVDKGHIGKLASITLNFFQTIPHSSWYLDNGVILETLAHPIDLSNWFSKSVPKEVLCSVDNHLGGLKEDRASIVIKYDSGITSNINGGWIADYPHFPGRHNICFQLVGTGGYICGVRPDKLILCDEQGSHVIPMDVVDPIKLELQDFAACITNGSTPSIGIDDAILAQIVIDSALRSASSGGTVARPS